MEVFKGNILSHSLNNILFLENTVTFPMTVCLVNIIFAVFYLYSNSILVFLAITEGCLYAFITEGLY